MGCFPSTAATAIHPPASPEEGKTASAAAADSASEAPVEDEKVTKKPGDSHEDFLARYAAKAASKQKGKASPWGRVKSTLPETVNQQALEEASAPEWLREHVGAVEAGGVMDEPTRQQQEKVVQAATWAARALYNKRDKEGASSSRQEEPAKPLHKTAKVFGEGGVRAPGMEYDKVRGPCCCYVRSR